MRPLRSEDEGCRGSVEKLGRYWAPIRQYVRAAWAKNDHDADDLTQEFFLWLLQADALARYATERGSFWSYLKGLLRNFSRNRYQASRALKRGGGRAVVALDANMAIASPTADDLTEEAFDKAFAREVTSRAIQQLKERLTRSARAVHWRVFEDFDLIPVAERPTYKVLAQRLGIAAGDVRNYLHRVRSLLRYEIRELLETVATTAELEQEWRHVVGA